MIREIREKIKDAILVDNDYMFAGFANVSVNPMIGVVVDMDDMEIPVFPADTFGNFFYLRSDGDVKFGGSIGTGVSDDNSALGVSFGLVLVACVKDADEDSLLNNMLNTLMDYQNDYWIEVASADVNKYNVVAKELSGMDRESKMKALSNIPKESTIISIKLNIRTIFNKSNCKNEIICRC